MFLIILLIGLFILNDYEGFINDRLISYQQCGLMVNTFPTFLKCNYFKTIENKDIKKKGINFKNPLLLTTKNNNLVKLNVNTYTMNKLYKKETLNCKTIIDWLMSYCRYQL